jgi:hypothetical protein
VHAPSEEKSDDSKDSFNEILEQVFRNFPKYVMIILEKKKKNWGEDIFKLTVGYESLHLPSNDNGVNIVNFVT